MAVLSIQSSVVLGSVGNAAAVFALRRLGFDVWPVASVRFSNHPGYGAWRGRVTDGAEVADLVAGLADLGALADCRAVLTGYLGSADVAAAAAGAVDAVRAARPDAVYCCDPVMGDAAEGLYVADDLVAALAADLVPRADVLAPNAFELSVLSGPAAAGPAEAVAAARRLIGRDGRPGLVAVTSVLAGPDAVANLAVTADGAWQVTTPRLPLAAKGAGDAFAALLLARILEGDDPAAALGAATAAVFGLVRATAEAGARELCLATAQDQMVAPSQAFPVRPLTPR